MGFWDLVERDAERGNATFQHRLIVELPHECFVKDRLPIKQGIRQGATRFDRDTPPSDVAPDSPGTRGWRCEGCATRLGSQVSAMTFFEKRRGAERLRRTDPGRARTILAAIDAIEAAYRSRIVPIDASVVAEWARLLGAKDKNQRDRALAATARIHGLVLVTRNIDDVRGCDVDVLDPFTSAPQVRRV